jgi:hypothetical protein
MHNDKRAAEIERAADAHARAALAEQGKLWTRGAILAALQTAYIAGYAGHARDSIAAGADLVGQLRRPGSAAL